MNVKWDYLKPFNNEKIICIKKNYLKLHLSIKDNY